MDQGEVLLSRSGKLRLLRGMMYAGLAISGILATMDKSSIVVAQVSFTVAILWSVAMAVSAVICLAGAITDRWIGEFSGLPLLVAVIAMYSIAAVGSAWENKDLFHLAFGFFAFSYGVGLAARWEDVRSIKKAASEGGANEEGRSG